MRYFPELEWSKMSQRQENEIKKKYTRMLLFEKLHSFYFLESNVTKLYSNMKTLINVPLLILRKIEYLQFT